MATRVASIGQVLELAIDGLGHEGQGVGRWHDTVVFVPGALPQETIRARVRRLARRHLEADLLGVETPSPQRIRPVCILAERCGGCSLQHCHLDAQAAFKTDQVRQALLRIGQLDSDQLPESVLQPIWQADTAVGYRNRALIPLERTAEGILRAGYYRRGSHRIVNMNRCPVLDPRIDGLIEPIKGDLEAANWPVDVNLNAGGGLRHLGLRVGHHSGEVLITLISSHGNLPGLGELASRWLEQWPQVVGVCLNLQPRASNVVLGAETRCVAGRPWLREQFAGIDLQIGADTFFQVNTPQAERLVPLLSAFLEAASAPRLVDAYCGIGTFSLPLALAGASVLGLEVHGQSVEQAEASAHRNGLETARFQQADVAAVLSDHLAACDGLLVDPPRKGLQPEVLQAIVGAAPPKLAYISCNPATLARDLAQLMPLYALQRVQPVDFFPQTSHVEAVALLSRRS